MSGGRDDDRGAGPGRGRGSDGRDDRGSDAGSGAGKGAGNDPGEDRPRDPARSDEESFAALADGVRRIEGPRRRTPRPGAASRTPKPASSAPPARALLRPDPDQPLFARAADLSVAQHARLARGELPPDRRLDLHGLTETAARERFRRVLDEAWRAGERCLLVIHGRGQRSGVAALREALPGWLDAASRRVLGSAPAAQRDGGEGASYIWLRRRK